MQELLSFKILAIPDAAAAGMLLKVLNRPSPLLSHMAGRVITPVDPCLLPGLYSAMLWSEENASPYWRKRSRLLTVRTQIIIIS